MVTRGEGREEEGGKIGERPSRNMYKGHMGTAKRGRFKGGKLGWLGLGGMVGGK